MKETKTAKEKAKPKEGDLLYLRTPGTEVFHQVPMMMEKETAEEEMKAGVAPRKEKTKTETKGKEDNCPPWWQSWQVDPNTGLWHWHQDPYWHADTNWHWHADPNWQEDQEPRVYRYHTRHRGWH